MSLDLSKYRVVFIEEATEHLSEMSSALLELEKDTSNSEAIDLIFRMAHGIKGMAASLEYASITEVSHRLEDRMAAVRASGSLESGEEVALLFHGLEALEAMVAVVRETGGPPPLDFPVAVAFLEAHAATACPDPEAAPKKKVLRYRRARRRPGIATPKPPPPRLPFASTPRPWTAFSGP